MTHYTSENEIPTLLYQDEDLLIVNKPSGLLSIPDGYNPSLPHLKSVLEPLYGNLWIIHRLDKETSGVIVLAKNSAAHRQLNQTFRERQIEKFYHGLVTPVPKWREMTIDLPLQTNADREHRTRVNLEKGKPAQTICKVLKIFSLGVLMELQILTGVTHQIRAHLRAHELTLLGEQSYNAGLHNPLMSAERLMLHARTLSFAHPQSNSWLSITAPYPEDFRCSYTKLQATTTPDEVI